MHTNKIKSRFVGNFTLVARNFQGIFYEGMLCYVTLQHLTLQKHRDQSHCRVKGKANIVNL